MKVDLVQTLRDIEQRAHQARLDLAEGRATSGVSALTRIQHEAGDTLRQMERLEAQDAQG